MSEQTPVTEPVPTTSTPSTTSSETPTSQVTTPVETPSSEPVVEPKVETPATEVVAPVEPVAEEYELELSETSNLSVEDLNEIAAEASRLNLSKEDAQKLIDAREKAFTSGKSKYEAEYKAKMDSARAEILAAPEFNGEAAPKTWESINRAVATFGDAEMVALLNTPEIGNNVVIARFLKRLGDVMAPDTLPGKGTVVPSKDAENEGLKTWYPSFFKEK